MPKSKAENLFNVFSKGLNTILKVRRELRASRSEVRADKREIRAEENHENKTLRYFGRPIENHNSRRK